MANLVKSINTKAAKAENQGGTIEMEKPIIFYNVDEEGTLTYLSHTKDGLKNVEIKLEDMHVNIQKGGNIKTGKEWLLNTLPGDHLIKVQGRELTNVHGSCQGCCDGCESFCYAINGARQHHNAVVPSTIKNLILYRMDPVRFEEELDAELSKWSLKTKEDKVFRWHASGEIEDRNYLDMMMRVAEKHPDVHFYSYTKRFMWIKDYLDIHEDFPTNFVWNLSVWGDNLEKSGFPKEYLSKVQRFEWKDEISVEEYNHNIHCQSVIHDKEGEKKGHLNHEKNCRVCGLCWRGRCKGRTILVYNH